MIQGLLHKLDINWDIHWDCVETQLNGKLHFFFYYILVLAYVIGIYEI